MGIRFFITFLSLIIIFYNLRFMKAQNSLCNVNSCTYLSALSASGQASYNISYFSYGYEPPCLIVDVGTNITFINSTGGTFSNHPLYPGVNQTSLGVEGNPIQITPNGSIATFQMTQTGVYPYYCYYHWLSYGMEGVIYVGNECTPQPPTSPPTSPPTLSPVSSSSSSIKTLLNMFLLILSIYVLIY